MDDPVDAESSERAVGAAAAQDALSKALSRVVAELDERVGAHWFRKLLCPPGAALFVSDVVERLGLVGRFSVQPSPLCAPGRCFVITEVFDGGGAFRLLNFAGPEM